MSSHTTHIRMRSKPSARLRAALARSLRVLLPERCLFCGAGAARDSICLGCLDDLPGGSVARCPVCAIELDSGELCGACLVRQPAFDRVRTAFTYDFPLDAAIQRFKYALDLTLAEPLGALLAAAVSQEPAPDLVLPMPLSPQRLRARGFNQALELARVCARRRGVPMDIGLVRRLTDAPAQVSLPWAQRLRNVRGAFSCTGDLAGVRIAIVDDVMTTGASLEEMARTLKRAGAPFVAAWVLARTPRQPQGIGGY